MKMEIAELLDRDVDDLTTLAAETDSATRDDLLASAARAIARPSIARLKAIALIQALAALSREDLSAKVAGPIAASLITATRADDPSERLGALRALAVVVNRSQVLDASMAHAVLATLERARVDSKLEIRTFADEVLSPGSRVFHRLIAPEVDDPELVAMVARHAPEAWREELPPERIQALLDTDVFANMIVLAADIKAASQLMRSAIVPPRFAAVISEWVDRVRMLARGGRGWFDKFTGDGVVLYWLVEDRDLDDYAIEAVDTAYRMIHEFRDFAGQLQLNSVVVSTQVGLSIGLAVGHGYLVRISGELTIVGEPLGTALRSASHAQPYEVIAGAAMGQRLLSLANRLRVDGVAVEETQRDHEIVFALTVDR